MDEEGTIFRSAPIPQRIQKQQCLNCHAISWKYCIPALRMFQICRWKSGVWGVAVLSSDPARANHRRSQIPTKIMSFHFSIKSGYNPIMNHPNLFYANIGERKHTETQTHIWRFMALGCIRFITPCWGLKIPNPDTVTAWLPDSPAGVPCVRPKNLTSAASPQIRWERELEGKLAVPRNLE
jgi:hypothetical protein